MNAKTSTAVKWTTQGAYGFTWVNNPPQVHVAICGARRAYVVPSPGVVRDWSVRCNDFSATFATFKEARAAALVVVRGG